MFERMQAAVAAFSKEHEPVVRPIADFAEACSTFLDSIATAAEAHQIDDQVVRSLVNSVAQLALECQQDVLKQVSAAAMASAAQQRRATRLAVPARPKLVGTRD